MLDTRVQFENAEKRGSLYYVRLNTRLGKFYKIGFTTLKSVNDRLAFQGTGDEKFIEEVLYFEPHDNALELEECLHTYFSEKAAFPKYSAYADMPLPRNGQSELYFDDVLGLDSKFTSTQADLTRKSVELAVAKRTYESEVWAKRVIAANNAIFGVLMVVAKIIGWSVKKIQALFGYKPVESQLPPSIIEIHNKAKKFLRQLKQVQASKSIRAHKEIKILRLIYAFANRDIEEFRAQVNFNELGRDIANSMTSDLIMSSDYLGIPHSCSMFALMELMNHDNCHELLVKPIVDSYIPMIEEYISSRKITDMSIRMPSDPIYAVDPEYTEYAQTFTDYFGAQEFKGLLECRFISRGAFIHDELKNTIEFSVELEDEMTRRRFNPRIVVKLEKMLRLSFPNLNELIREYQEQHERKPQTVQ